MIKSTGLLEIGKSLLQDCFVDNIPINSPIGLYLTTYLDEPLYMNFEN